MVIIWRWRLNKAIDSRFSPQLNRNLHETCLDLPDATRKRLAGIKKERKCVQSASRSRLQLAFYWFCLYRYSDMDDNCMILDFGKVFMKE